MSRFVPLVFLAAVAAAASLPTAAEAGWVVVREAPTLGLDEDVEWDDEAEVQDRHDPVKERRKGGLKIGLGAAALGGGAGFGGFAAWILVTGYEAGAYDDLGDQGVGDLLGGVFLGLGIAFIAVAAALIVVGAVLIAQGVEHLRQVREAEDGIGAALRYEPRERHRVAWSMRWGTPPLR